jgi:hypothetical protein
MNNLTVNYRRLVEAAIEHFRTHPHPFDNVNWGHVFGAQLRNRKRGRRVGATVRYPP